MKFRKIDWPFCRKAMTHVQLCISSVNNFAIRWLNKQQYQPVVCVCVCVADETLLQLRKQAKEIKFRTIILDQKYWRGFTSSSHVIPDYRHHITPYIYFLGTELSRAENWKQKKNLFKKHYTVKSSTIQRSSIFK